jgi:hypothetical protein
VPTFSALEASTRAFYDWESRGRGGHHCPFPISLEPSFQPFVGHVDPTPPGDDARHPTLLSTLFERIQGSPRKAVTPPRSSSSAVAIASPASDRSCKLLEWDILVPIETKVAPEANEAWLRAACASSGPLSFELLGADGKVTIRMAAEDPDAESAEGSLRAFFPSVSPRTAAQGLHEWWSAGTGDTIGGIEFSLAREFMVPLRLPEEGLDPLTPFIGALAGLRAGERAVVQMLFERVRAPWAAHAMASVTTPDGEPFFLDAPEITELAREKCGHPLCAAAFRIALQCHGSDRGLRILRGIAGALAQYGNPNCNDLAPLPHEDTDLLVADVLDRVTHRTGMILSLPELSGFVRVPSEQLKHSALVRTPESVSILPKDVLGTSGAMIGEALHRGAKVEVRITPEARMQHVYVIGGSGVGKSTLMQRMILDDIAAGAGVGVLDPHGDLVDEVLSRIPDNRLNDVVMFDPTDAEATAGWNILGAHSDIEKELLASDLVAVFRRLSTSWGDQMSVVLGNAIMAFLESARGGTLVDLRRFLLDEDFRAQFLGTVTDSHIKSFWRDEWPLLAGKRPQAPILTRLDIFLRSRLVREAVTRKVGIDFRRLIDGGKIFLGKLAQGTIGEENAALLGALLASKFHQVSLSRQNVAIESRRPFYLFIDEFQEVVVPSMASLFSGLRKYRLGVTVAHHSLHQLHVKAPEVEHAILTNAFTRIFFRVSDEDARKLERGLAGFSADDLTGLGRGEAIVRVEHRDQAFRLRTLPLDPVDPKVAFERRTRVREQALASRRAEPPRAADPVFEPIERVAAPDPPAAATKRLAPAKKIDVEATTGLPGRGGPQHKYLQSLVKRLGEERGFRATLEKRVLDGAGHIDVALEREGLSIGCEISVTTPTANELNNLSKCMAAGFDFVVLVSSQSTVLSSTERQMVAEGGPDAKSRMRFVSPENLADLLDGLTAKAPGPTGSIRGYRITTQYQTLSPKQQVDRDRVLSDVIAKSLTRVRWDT